MPKKATKTEKPKSKSVERREAVQTAKTKIKTYLAADARVAYDNGDIADREIVALAYPNDHVPMVGFAAFVRDQMFVRQCEIPSDDRVAIERGEQQYNDLVKFLETVEDPA